MDLVDGSFSFGTVKGYPLYQVHFGRRYIYLIDNPLESVPDIDNSLSPTYYCDHYIPFWVSWIDGTIEAGEGTCIGHDKFDSMPRILNTFTDVTEISIMSNTTADWLFDIPKNTTSDCTPDESTVGSGSGPTKIRTTETTTPEFGSTTISSTIRTKPEFASTTISSTDTTTPEFASTTISSTNTTTPEFASTTISSTDTTTPEFATTTKSSTNTTTPEFASTTISSTDTTTPEFGSTTINSTYTTTPEFESTTKSSTDTTLPEFATTTKSSTGTSPEFASTTISSTDTTPEFDPTTISTISSTATTASSRTTYRSSTKSPCTCSCNNFILTEDELIRKIALLKSELSVDRKQTNKYKRSLISASDDRPSSKCIGTFGIVVLVVICTLIVLMDLQHCSCFMFQKKK
ncbi:unnamed protein product [Mytilus edulis]|uniref:Uncharacterized protein n=1 Tax=Mytilus edulis TaxID=6550 RepID=A0A8S3PVI0_MYTED|nr:unnamed protein product [Mytilus edulis]